MTPSRTLAAAGALVATLVVAGCSFSGSAQASGGSTSAASPSPRTSAAAKPATPATPSTPVGTTSPSTSSSSPAPPGAKPPSGSKPSSARPSSGSKPSSGAGQAPAAPAPAPQAPSGQIPAGQAPSNQAPSNQAPAAPQGSAPSPCTADALDYEVPVPVKGPGGSASSTTSLVLRNTGTTTCTLYGYPGVSFVAGDDRHQAGAAADRRSGTAPARVTLVPGSAALAPLTIAANASVGAACQPTDVVGLLVYPPGSTEAVLVDRPATACGGPDAHQLVVGPVRTG